MRILANISFIDGVHRNERWCLSLKMTDTIDKNDSEMGPFFERTSEVVKPLRRPIKYNSCKLSQTLVRPFNMPEANKNPARFRARKLNILHDEISLTL